MRALDDPASGPPLGVAAPQRKLHAPLGNMQHVAGSPRRVVGRLPGVALIRTEVLTPGLRGRPRDDYLGERGDEEHGIMSLGPAHDEGERDSTPVDEEAALGALFSPGPSDSGRRLPGQGGL